MGIILCLSFAVIVLVILAVVWSMNAGKSRAKAREADQQLREARNRPDQTTATRGTGIN